MPAPKEVLDLIERFDRNREAYLSGPYNETQLRREFIDPFFEALGWDITNKAGDAEAYKQVVHEDAIKIGGATKAPDYSFRIGGTRKFFLEAKKPSINIVEDPNPAYQLRRYAWSAKLPLSILTNFKEFVVYDCRKKPLKTEKASAARIMCREYTEYPQCWDEIASIFSHDAIRKGSFDKYAESSKHKKGTTEVDTAFLNEIEHWRDILARNLASRNPKLSQRELNFAVQRTIDRIIFLRICEDRGAERYGSLLSLLNGQHIYKRLCKLLQDADDKYNSGLFHFREEPDRAEEPDRFTLNLQIDDTILKNIIGNLYYPDSPYEFSVLSADILGQIYEQFLGKVIRLTPGHHAKVELKPEVRKAGGVYYTPPYIVNYIVKNTVGSLVEGKTPKQVAKLKILDPACGSGSFLINAYQLLLDWHRDRYLEEGPQKHKRELFPANGGEWRLTTEEKKRILLNNIYGVDIDPQAVEVTKLSLLLKVLEGENENTLNKQYRLLHQRALPDLGKNIKCGNSLIGPEFYNNHQMNFLGEEDQYIINIFDWHSEFPEILKGKDAGFDAVIGNPPYLNVDDTWGHGDVRLAALKKLYPLIYNDKTDILFYFLAKAITLSKSHVSFIVSRAFLEAYKADKLRAYILKTAAIKEIIDFRNFHVFPRVGITTCIITLSPRLKPDSMNVYKLIPEKLPVLGIADTLSNRNIFERIKLKQHKLNAEPWTFVSDIKARLNNKIDEHGQPLGNILVVGSGMQTGRNEVFGKRTKKDITRWRLKPGQYYKRVTNSDIQRYSIIDRGEYLIYLEEVPSFEDLPKGVRQHLQANSQELKARAAFRRGDCEWWQYTWPLHQELYDQPRILCPYMSKSNRFALDFKKEYISLTDTTVMFDNEQHENLRYFLGILNSKLLTFRFQNIGKLKSAGILEYVWNSVSKLPIRRINFSDAKDKTRHDRMLSLVNSAIHLNERVLKVKTEHETNLINRQIEALDNQIDKITYELYDLTEEEIAIVEGNF